MFSSARQHYEAVIKTQQIMLTAHDLHQISLLLDQKLDQKLDEKLAPIHATLVRHERILTRHEGKLNSLEKQLSSFGKQLGSFGKQLGSFEKQLKSLKKDQVLILDTLDREQLYQRKRLDRVESHLGLSSLV
jgi:septal ring factor EnvC (AmiA/AmiB activator)